MENKTFGQLKEGLFGLIENEQLALDELIEKIILARDSGNVSQINSILADIKILRGESKDMERYVAALHNKGITDGITNLHTRSYINELIPEGFKPQVAYLMGDVDKFKPYNSAYGHPQGDTALAHIAGMFKESIEESVVEGEKPFIFRYGGEEFGTFIENFQGDSIELEKRANLIRKGVEDLIIPRNNESIFAEEYENDTNYKHKTITIAGSIAEAEESAEKLMGRVNGVLNRLKEEDIRGVARVE